MVLLLASGFLAMAARGPAAQEQQQVVVTKERNPDVPIGSLRFDLGIMRPVGIKATCGKLGLAIPLDPRVTAKFSYQGWRIASMDDLKFSAGWELSLSVYIGPFGGHPSWRDANRKKGMGKDDGRQ
jgi:hypothetical protein